MAENRALRHARGSGKAFSRLPRNTIGWQSECSLRCKRKARRSRPFGTGPNFAALVCAAWGHPPTARRPQPVLLGRAVAVTGQMTGTAPRPGNMFRSAFVGLGRRAPTSPLD